MSDPGAGLPGQGEGLLYVVATPIGNLEDITLRARRILAEVDLVLAEDTRRTARLLAHLGIDTPLKAYHDHNEREQATLLVERVRDGARLALVSDAGTPLLSDPGFWLVRAAREAGLPVVPVPGVSAVTAALSVAGLPTDCFVFEGFLPARAGARARALEHLAAEPRTLVLFEAPHRIADCIAACLDAFGAQRPATLARELTKRFETIRHGTLGELNAWLGANPDQQRGEFVVVVGGASADQVEGGQGTVSRVSEDALLRGLLEVLPPGKAAALAARTLGRPRREFYARALVLAGRAGHG